MNTNDRKFLDVPTRYQARKLAPWAAKIRKVEGGYVAYRYVTDYDHDVAQR